jgi:hypothetical protein
MSIPKQNTGFIHQGRSKGGGGGLGIENAGCAPRFVDERPTNRINPHEADHRGQARAADMSNTRGRQTGGNTDVGGR